MEAMREQRIVLEDQRVGEKIMKISDKTVTVICLMIVNLFRKVAVIRKSTKNNLLCCDYISFNSG